MVLVVGLSQSQGFGKDWSVRYDSFISIGDCVQTRRLVEAIAEGFEIAVRSSLEPDL